MAKGAAYPFPVRDYSQLVGFFQKEIPELGFTVEDIKKPKANRIQSFYLKMLELLVGVNQECIFQTSLSASKVQEYPEYHEYSNKLVNLTMAMRRLMFACGYDDFNLRDIVDPVCQRMQVIMSALLNFFYFSADRKSECDMLIHEKNAIGKQINEVKQENESLQMEINNMRAKEAQQQPELDMLVKKLNASLEDFHELQEFVNKTNKVISEIKVELGELQLRKTKLEESITAARHEGDLLSQQIVQSPERMMVEREKMEKYLQNVQEMVRSLQEQRDSQHRRHNIYTAILTKLQTVHDTMCSIVKQECNKHHDGKEKLVGLEKQTMEKKEYLAELQRKSQQLRCKVTSKQEKLAKLNLQYDNALASLQECLAQERRNAEILAKEKKEVMEKEMERRSLIQEAQSSQAEHERNLDLFTQKYEKLLEQVESYNATLQEQWGMLRESMEDMKIAPYSP